MYSSTSYTPSASPYHSPPPDPYRSSPIAVSSRQPYSGALSPPPVPPNPNGFAPIPVAQPRYQQPYSRTSNRGYPAQPTYSQSHTPVPQQPSQLPPARHKGTLAPGQIIKVGEHEVRIERYLSEGGYAHVYLTRSDKPIYLPRRDEVKKGRWGEKGFSEHCLKRIAFEDESVWADVRKEIEVMKSLPPNPHLTQYLGSAHSRLPNGGYEVFILMEFCAGGGIIDLLNKRLRDRLQEIEILNIFTDVCEAVAAMHALSRPLLHRDLKIENVLSQPLSSGPSKTRPTPLMFKLCDFGSTTFPASHPPNSKIEADALAMDLNKNTTLQYRSPEMVEPMLGWAVGLPSDVWALGVLLYKLCYYTTPFEEHGTLAIVNAKYTFPQFPVYSPRIQHLIASMLVEQPQRRPSVFEVLSAAHEMSGTQPEVDYPMPSRSRLPARTAQPEPINTSTTKPTSGNLLDFTSPTSPIDTTPVMQPNIASTIQPQRRGRPTREPSRQQLPTLPQPPNISSSQPKMSGSTPQIDPRMQLQVTGDKVKPSTLPKTTPSGKLDAFGMPAMSGSKSSSGFGETFNAPKGSASSDWRARQAVTNNKAPSGFSDSFASRSSISMAPRNSVASTSTTSSTGFGNSFTTLPKTTSPKAGISSSMPDGEVSFETRFPSVETLSAEDTIPLNDAGSLGSSARENLISPITSPPTSTLRPLVQQRQSMMGSVTGGPSTNHVAKDGPVQPRSTHVTGTAFKSTNAPPQGSSPVKERAGYFEGLSGNPGETQNRSPGLLAVDAKLISAGKETVEDLMTGNMAETMGEAPIRMSLPERAPSNGERPLPQPPTAKPVPPKHLRKASSTFGGLADSSDEEEGPEDASRQRPRAEEYAPIFEDLVTAPDPSQQIAAGTPSTAILNDPETVSTGVYRPANRRLISSRDRPQSMISLPSNPSTSYRNLLSPPATDKPDTNLPTPSPKMERPGHVRKGSINDIVSRFESLSPGLEKRTSRDTATATKKPNVAAKPAALRKPTLPIPVSQPSTSDTAQPIPTTSTGAEPFVTSPIKAKPELAKKPDLLKQPSKFGETPAPVGYSKSSSGRSFPIVKPTPNPNPILPPKPALHPSSTPVQSEVVKPVGEIGKEKEGSPEKQQPVNMLIQRWNQGNVGVGKPAGANGIKRGG